MTTPKQAPMWDVTRRGLMTAAGAGGLLLASGSRGRAQASGTLKIGFVSPRSGALAGFGETDGYVLQEARKALANGLPVNGKTYAVQILDRDTQSDPARAGQMAKSLINDAGVDMILSTSTPEVVNPVADACEAAGVPSLSTVMPWEAFYFGRGAKPGQPSPFRWTYLFSFGTGQFATSYLSQWSLLPTNKKVGVMYPNDADGNAIRAHLAPLLAKGGFTIVDPGPYEDGTTDYSAQIALFKQNRCEIFNTFPIPPDFATFWRQAAQQGYTRMVKIAQIAKTGLFPSQVEAVGSLGPTLATAVYWHPDFPYKSPLTGISGHELIEGYEKSAGKQWTQQLGASMSLLDVGFAALRASGNPKDKAAVAQALSKLDTPSMVGKVDFTKGPVPNVFATPIIGAQWVKAKPGSRFKLDCVITENATDRNVPVSAKLMPYV
ncbi:MAG: ABC transporter substrate-binding protein [Rhodospirillales bacterium]|nr:ABC transporter substrate-binding protein [Rhodospirillales bacterium]